MSKLKNVCRLIFDKKYRFCIFASCGIYKKMSDEKFLEKAYQNQMKKKLNLKNPTTYNEKLQWLKLYDRKPIYTTMVDKYEAKRYVANVIGEEYVIPTLGIYDKVEDIDFESLPNQFVLKCTHDSGGIVICRDKLKFDKVESRRKINKFLKRQYYLVWREWPYKDVKPRIIAEQYMEDATTEGLRDYKFFCFGGDPKMILVCAERFASGGLRENFYDPDWNLLPVQRPHHPNTDYDITKPQKLQEMLEIARKLSKNIPFSRIDLYEVNGKIYFGEITFFPASGIEAFEPDEWDEKIGSWIELPGKTK